MRPPGPVSAEPAFAEFPNVQYNHDTHKGRFGHNSGSREMSMQVPTGSTGPGELGFPS